MDKQPISSAYFFDCHNELIGVSNQDGIVDLSSACFPVTAKHFEYNDQLIGTLTDTLFLEFKYDELDEVVIKPVVKMDLYNGVIAQSHVKVLKNQGTRTGHYFESLMIVDQTTNDTCFIDKTCELTIQSTMRKGSKQYAFFSEKGRQTIDPFQLESSVKDTVVIVKMLGILPSFESNFKFDLTNVKEYKLDYNENEIGFIQDELEGLLFQNKRSGISKSNKAYFSDSLLRFWNATSSHAPHYDGQSTYFNFDRVEKTYGFDSAKYEMNSILSVVELSAFLSGHLFQFSMVKGFIETPETSAITSNSVDSVEDYFEQLPFTENTPRYFVFE